jgi:hypothetical protein
MFADHEQQMNEVVAKIARFGVKDEGSWLAMGSVEVAAADDVATGGPTE